MWRVTRLARLAIVTLFCPALAAAGQAPLPQNPPVFRTGVELVDVTVVVYDRDGRPVNDLTAADFEVTERGIPQAVTVFDRISIPAWRREGATQPRAVPSDVSTNEGIADGRVFVLVLDSLHVSPGNVVKVTRNAKRFVQDHTGPGDLVAVVTPGGLETASQDFTSDQARLLAAIDRFAATKLRSATLEIDDERLRAAASGLPPIHQGKDPSDAERAYRAQSISSSLQALATHLSRVERRRKALLLFSEGIDYNVGDLMGAVQVRAGDVRYGMERAVGALMRANVSLYAIDPRALGQADTIERRLADTGPTAPRIDGSMPRLDGSDPSLDEEYRSSVTSLRLVSEATGGFAAVTSNDVSASFDRIVRESSDYYVVGYTPSPRGKPGTFQPLGVRVTRPGLRAVARQGYYVPLADASAERAPAPTRRDAPRDASTPPAGVPPELAALLSSPLPASGLTMRVQAVPFKGGEAHQVVQLVIEVLGDALGFVERDGRFESRVDLASFTVDASGRSGNGRSTTIDLRLTPEEHQRVTEAGLRWLYQLDLAPGQYQLRVAARAPATGASGLVTTGVDVPAAADGAWLSGVVLTSSASAAMVTRGQTRLATTLHTPPTAIRRFALEDQITAAVEVYLPASATASTLSVTVEDASGEVVLRQRQPLPAAGGQPRVAEAALPIDASELFSGSYVLRVRLDGTGSPAAERVVPFVLGNVSPE